MRNTPELSLNNAVLEKKNRFWKTKMKLVSAPDLVPNH